MMHQKRNQSCNREGLHKWAKKQACSAKKQLLHFTKTFMECLNQLHIAQRIHLATTAITKQFPSCASINNKFKNVVDDAPVTTTCKNGGDDYVYQLVGRGKLIIQVQNFNDLLEEVDSNVHFVSLSLKKKNVISLPWKLPKSRCEKILSCRLDSEKYYSSPSQENGDIDK